MRLIEGRIFLVITTAFPHQCITYPALPTLAGSPDLPSVLLKPPWSCLWFSITSPSGNVAYGLRVVLCACYSLSFSILPQPPRQEPRFDGCSSEDCWEVAQGALEPLRHFTHDRMVWDFPHLITPAHTETIDWLFYVHSQPLPRVFSYHCQTSLTLPLGEGHGGWGRLYSLSLRFWFLRSSLRADGWCRI